MVQMYKDNGRTSEMGSDMLFHFLKTVILKLDHNLCEDIMINLLKLKINYSEEHVDTRNCIILLQLIKIITKKKK